MTEIRAYAVPALVIVYAESPADAMAAASDDLDYLCGTDSPTCAFLLPDEDAVTLHHTVATEAAR